MKLLLAIAITLAALNAQANSSYYCNGATKQSGSYWYFPNGATAQSGSYVYYPNGATLKSGSYLYFRNGATFVSGDYLYYSSGATLKSGSYFYYANGATLKSGSYCYYENGASMGSCPSSMRIQAGLGENDLEAVISLETGEIDALVHSFEINGKAGYLKLSGAGNVIDIQHECAGSTDSAVSDLVSKYRTLTPAQKTEVRKNICQ